MLNVLGYVDAKCLYAAVQLGVPDQLSTGAKRLDELAEKCRARQDRLQQIMRVLRNKGIFAWNPEAETYSLNEVSELLTTEHWTQWHNWVELYGDVFYDIARGIYPSLLQDCKRTAAQVNFDTDENMFEYFTAQGWVPRLHKTLGGGATAQSPGIVKDYPWAEFGKGPFLDVGGGEGALVASLLREFKSLTGALLDSTEVIEHAKRMFHDADGKFGDVADRLSQENMMAGNFFQSVPSYEFYSMKWCLHDWKDPEAKQILNNIRRAIKITPECRLVVLESILSDGWASRLSRYADINMMITANGQERTEAEWTNLATSTGWKIARICYLRGAWPCAIEFRPVSSDNIGEGGQDMTA